MLKTKIKVYIFGKHWNFSDIRIYDNDNESLKNISDISEYIDHAYNIENCLLNNIRSLLPLYKKIIFNLQLKLLKVHIMYDIKIIDTDKIFDDYSWIYEDKSEYGELPDKCSCINYIQYNKNEKIKRFEIYGDCLLSDNYEIVRRELSDYDQNILQLSFGDIVILNNGSIAYIVTNGSIKNNGILFSNIYEVIVNNKNNYDILYEIDQMIHINDVYKVIDHNEDLVRMLLLKTDKLFIYTDKFLKSIGINRE